MPAKLSGLVSEKHPVSANKTKSFVQPTPAAAATTATNTALPVMSTAIAHADPTRSISDPAIGLMISPGATAANANQPASTVECTCVTP